MYRKRIFIKNNYKTRVSKKPIGVGNRLKTIFLKSFDDKKKRKVFFLVGIVFVLIALSFSFLTHSKNEIAGENSDKNNDVVSYSTDTPDESPPGDNYSWKGSFEDPKWIRIPSIGVVAYVQKVGVDQHRQIAVPNNIHIVGWFVDSVLPGQKGLSIIDGHRDGRVNGGIFRNLEKLQKDDIFEVELGSGEIKKFKVMSVESIDLEKTASKLFSQDPKVTSQLNLISCGGTFNYNTGTYDQRILVTAELIE